MAAILHVVVHPLPAAGHVIPCATLAQKLASSRLFFVTFACAHHRLFDHRAGQQLAHQLHHYPNIRVLDLQESLPPHVCAGVDDGAESLGRIRDAVLSTREPFERAMAELMATASPPVCLITDFVVYALEVAQHWHIPWYLFCPMAARQLALMLYAPQLHCQARLPPLKLTSKSEISQHELADVDVLAHDSDIDLNFILPAGLPPWLLADVREFSSLSVDSNPADLELRQRIMMHCYRTHNSQGILVNTFRDLEAEAMDIALHSHSINPHKLPIYSVGPLISSQVQKATSTSTASSRAMPSPPTTHEGNSDDDQWLQWMSKLPSSSVIYISFGTIVTPLLDQIKELACALEASKRSFLWIVRPPAGTIAHHDQSSKGFDNDDVAKKILPDGFQARTAERGMFLSSWVSQQSILAHPATAGFFTHCGWNSAMESIFFGVPVIALPEFGDQNTNCKILVEQLAMGVEARRGADGIVCRKEVQRVMEVLMDEEEGVRMRKNARKWSEAARNAADSPADGSSSESIRAFFESFSSQNPPGG